MKKMYESPKMEVFEYCANVNLLESSPVNSDSNSIFCDDDCGPEGNGFELN